MLITFLGQGNPLLFTPVTVSPARMQQLDGVLVTAARILTIQATGHSGRTTVRIRTVMNFHDRWTPPPPNTGTMPGLASSITTASTDTVRAMTKVAVLDRVLGNGSRQTLADSGHEVRLWARRPSKPMRSSASGRTAPTFRARSSEHAACDA